MVDENPKRTPETPKIFVSGLDGWLPPPCPKSSTLAHPPPFRPDVFDGWPLIESLIVGSNKSLQF